MKKTLITKLESLGERREELDGLLSAPDVISDQNKFRGLAQERAEIDPVVECFIEYQKQLQELADTEEMLKEGDAEMREFAGEELESCKTLVAELEAKLEILLIPKDPADDSNIFLEIRAGTGGDEAGIFVGDLLRMYLRYAEHRGWKVEVMSASESEMGGYKEVIAKISRPWRLFAPKIRVRCAHRVQRVPETESQGRVHTSACTVAVMPEADEVTEH